MSADAGAKNRRQAYKVLQREYRKKNRRGNAFIRFVGIFVSILLIVFCGASMFIDMLELGEKQDELELLRIRAEALEIENASYRSILSEEDERTYMERIAIEKLGYAYPEERRFYDTTRN